MKKDYQYLIGKTREEIIYELGDEFDYLYSNVWLYFIKKNWLGIKTFLKIYFKNEKVKKVVMKSFLKKSVYHEKRQ